MVPSKNTYEKSDVEDSGSGRLLRDIEEISKALYLEKNPKLLRPPSQIHSWSSADNLVQNALDKDKKTSIWGWNPLKVLNHLRNHQFKCFFFLHVHSVSGLPSNLNDIVLCVNWKRKNKVLKTRAVRVFQGIAEFEETLMCRCTVYGSRNGPQHSAKYEPKSSLLHVSIIGAPALDIGKHRVDLTRLLPLTFEELAEKRTSGKWTTSFKLKGKAKGAFLSVSFGFSTLGDSPFSRNRIAEISNTTEGSGLTKLDHLADSGLAGNKSHLLKFGSFQIESNNRFHHLPSRSVDLKLTDEVLCNQKSELPTPVTLQREKLDERKPGDSEQFESNSNFAAVSDFGSGESENSLDDIDFVIVDRGIEITAKDELKIDDSCKSFSFSVIEVTETNENLPEEWMNCKEDKVANTDENKLFNDNISGSVLDIRSKNEDFQGEESNFGDSLEVSTEMLASEYALDTDNKKDDFQDEELEIKDHQVIVPDDILTSKSAELNFLVNVEQEESINPEQTDRAGRLVRSLSMDDVMDSVANEFLGMFTEQSLCDTSSESDPDSPRERLLRHFEEECPGINDSVLISSTGEEYIRFSIGDSANSERVPCSDDFDLSLVIQEAEKEHRRVAQSLRSRRNAKLLENLETETLMQRWGLNEKAFQHSPRFASGGFGSPVYIPLEEPSYWPPLGEGLDPVIPTKGGGVLRSMDSSLFKNAKNGARLVLQVSIPIVLPAVVGSNVLEILHGWASVGPERFLSQASELMPLEDITGKTLQQVMMEAKSSLEDRWGVLHEPRGGDCSVHNNDEEFVQNTHSMSSASELDEESPDYVSFGDLVHLVVDNIESLSIEGLKIQSGLSNVEAPSRTRANFTGNWSSTGWNHTLGEAMSSLSFTSRQNLAVKDDGYADVNDLIEHSLTLDQWLKLDAGDIGSKHKVDERKLRILAAHNANFAVLYNSQLSRDAELLNPSSSFSGLFSNTFVLALRLQLRDPFRDYEMVGGSMLALAQVERAYVPMEREEYMDSESNILHENSTNTKWVPRFRISEVHVAGLKLEVDDMHISIRRQLQMGSRWLTSNGMISKGKHLFSSSTAIIKPSSLLLKKLPCDILWSVTSPVQCTMVESKCFRPLNLNFRNPDVVFPHESVRLLKT